MGTRELWHQDKLGKISIKREITKTFIVIFKC